MRFRIVVKVVGAVVAAGVAKGLQVGGTQEETRRRVQLCSICGSPLVSVSRPFA